MNGDHNDQTIAMIKHYVGIPCSDAQIVSIDSLGMMVKAKIEVAGAGYNKIRSAPLYLNLLQRSCIDSLSKTILHLFY